MADRCPCLVLAAGDPGDAADPGITSYNHPEEESGKKTPSDSPAGESSNSSPPITSIGGEHRHGFISSPVSLFLCLGEHGASCVQADACEADHRGMLKG